MHPAANPLLATSHGVERAVAARRERRVSERTTCRGCVSRFDFSTYSSKTPHPRCTPAPKSCHEDRKPFVLLLLPRPHLHALNEQFNTYATVSSTPPAQAPAAVSLTLSAIGMDSRSSTAAVAAGVARFPGALESSESVSESVKKRNWRVRLVDEGALGGFAALGGEGDDPRLEGDVGASTDASLVTILGSRVTCTTRCCVRPLRSACRSPTLPLSPRTSFHSSQRPQRRAPARRRRLRSARRRSLRSAKRRRWTRRSWRGCPSYPIHGVQPNIRRFEKVKRRLGGW